MPEGYYKQGKPKKPKKPAAPRPKHVYTPAPRPEPRIPSSQPVSEHAMVSKARTAQRVESRARVHAAHRTRAAWVARHSQFIPPGLHEKVVKGHPLTEGEAFAAAIDAPLKTKEGQRRLATRGQRAKLASAQSAKRQRQGVLADLRIFPATAAAQPSNLYDAVNVKKKYPYTPGQAATTRKAEIAKVHNVKLAQAGKITTAEADRRNKKVDRQEHLRFKKLQAAGLVAPFNEGGVIGRSIVDLVSIGAHTPGGLVRMFSQNPIKTAKEIGLGVWDDFHHIGTYPDRALLDLFGAASGVAAIPGRAAAAAGTLAKVGEVGALRTTGQLAKDLAFSAPPKDRFLRNPHAPPKRPLTPRDAKVKALADQSPFTAEREVASGKLRDARAGGEAQGIHIQGSRNPILNRVIHPMYDYALPRVSPKLAERKYAIHKGRHMAVERAVNESHAAAVTRAGLTHWLGRRRLKTGEELGLRAVMEGMHPEDWARLHDQLKRMVPEHAGRHETMRKAWTEAMKEVHVEGRKLVMNDPKLQGLAEEMLRTSNAGHDIAVKYGLLDEAGAKQRVHGPRDIAGGIIGHTSLHDLDPQGYVSYAKAKTLGSYVRSSGHDIGSKMNLPPELRKAFSGESILRGHMPPLTTTSIGRVAMGRARIAHWFDSYDDLKAHGLKPTDPEILKAIDEKRLGKDYVALLPRKPGSEFRRELDDLLGKHDLAHDAPEVLGKLYTDLIRDNPAAHTERKGVLFVPKRLAKELRPEASHGKLNKSLRVYDEINRSAISAMLYVNGLKYLTVNAPGQIFLTMADQGILAPLNIKRAITMWHDVDGQTQAAALGAVGGRMEHAALGGQPTDPFRFNPLTRAGEKYSHVAGKILDDAPKITALVNEARKRGYRTAEDFQRLWSQDATPKMKRDRGIISRKVMDDYLDYSAMGASEKAMATRIFRFYPWLKASTRYVGRYMTEHPVQTAVLAQMGAQAQEHQQNVLGELPWYRHGLTPIGDAGDVIDPTSAGIVSQAPELAHDALNFIGKQPQEGMSYFAPVITDIAGAGGVQLGRDYPLKGDLLHRLGQTVGGQIPIAGLIQHPHGTPTMPRSVTNSLLRTFVGGGLIPTKPNLDLLHEQAQSEATNAMEPGQRVEFYTAKAWRDLQVKARARGITVPLEVKQGLERQQRRLTARINAGIDSKSSTRDRLRVDVDTAVAMGLISEEDSHSWHAAINKATKNRLSYKLSPALTGLFKGRALSKYASVLDVTVPS